MDVSYEGERSRLLWQFLTTTTKNEGPDTRPLGSHSTVCVCKICGFHGSDYEECRLLGYRNPGSYFTGDTSRLRYTVQPVNAMQDLRFPQR
jgi:hypothetical protein